MDKYKRHIRERLPIFYTLPFLYLDKPLLRQVALMCSGRSGTIISEKQQGFFFGGGEEVAISIMKAFKAGLLFILCELYKSVCILTIDYSVFGL